METWFSRGSAAEEIVHVAKEIGCDLIVMGTHGRTGLSRLLMGNTAESVLTKAGSPVIVVEALPGSIVERLQLVRQTENQTRRCSPSFETRAPG